MANCKKLDQITKKEVTETGHVSEDGVSGLKRLENGFS